MSDDEDVPCVRKKVEKVALDDDDDTPCVRVEPKKAVAADSDDDVPCTRPRAAAAADSDDEAPCTRKPAADVDSDDEGPSLHRSAAHRDPAELPPLASVDDWDALTEEQFVSLLKSVSRKDDQNARLVRRNAEADADSTKAADAVHGYSYEYLLTRALDELAAQHPSLGTSTGSRVQVMKPGLQPDGAKKTAVTNFKQICEFLNRSVEDVQEFIEVDLATTSSIDSNGCLIMRVTRLRPQVFEEVLLRYIEQWVKCSECGKINTVLERDQTTRLQQLQCLSCKATRTVQSGGTGFQANTTKRRLRKV